MAACAAYGKLGIQRQAFAMIWSKKLNSVSMGSQNYVMQMTIWVQKMRKAQLGRNISKELLVMHLVRIKAQPNYPFCKSMSTKSRSRPSKKLVAKNKLKQSLTVRRKPWKVT